MRPGNAWWAMRTATATTVFFALAIHPILAQSAQPVEVWRRSVPNHAGVMMDLDPADNVFAVGDGINNVVTQKYSPDGTLQWEQSLADRTRASWVSADPDGNAVVTATRISGVNSPSGWRVVKYGPAGNVVWEDTILVASGRTVRVETDDAGNAYVVGEMALVNEFGNYTLDTVTIKYAPNGTKLWTRVFNGGEYTTDRAASLAISDDGSRVAVVGGSSGWVFTAVYDAQGNQVGQLLREDLIFARDAAFGPQNELYVGTTSWTPETGDRMTIVKLAANGALLFIRSYTDGEFVYRMAVDSQGNVVAAGVKDVYFNWVTLKVEADGDRLWSQVYDGFGANDERPFFLTIDRFDDIYVTGDGGPAPPGSTISNTQAVTVKYSSSGNQEWVILDAPGARGVAVRIGTDLAVYVQELGEMLTVRYDQVGTPSESPPPAPSGLRAASRTATQIGLRWVNNSTDQDGVRIQRCKGVGCTNFGLIGQVGGTATTYADKGLTPNTTYRYRVRSYNDAGNSPWSNVVAAKTRL
jgi:Fibronectin type III domain